MFSGARSSYETPDGLDDEEVGAGHAARDVAAGPDDEAVAHQLARAARRPRFGRRRSLPRRNSGLRSCSRGLHRSRGGRFGFGRPAHDVTGTMPVHASAWRHSWRVARVSRATEWQSRAQRAPVARRTRLPARRRPQRPPAALRPRAGGAPSSTRADKTRSRGCRRIRRPRPSAARRCPGSRRPAMSPSAIWSLATASAVGASGARVHRRPLLRAHTRRQHSSRLPIARRGSTPADVQRVSHAAGARRRLEPVARAGDLGDPPVAELEQVSDRERRPRGLRRRTGAAVQGDDGHTGCRRGGRFERARVRCDEHDAIDALRKQVPDRGFDRRRIRSIRVGRGDPAPSRAGGGLEGGDAFRGSVEGGIGCHDTRACARCWCRGLSRRC